jgi:uncharacterized protein (DUF488 family)
VAKTVSTIGYEGAELEAFLATLLAAGIDHVVDVRAVPISRKRGFSKLKLAAALAEANIEYTHVAALGDPKAGREAMKRGDYETFFSIYSAHIASESGEAALSHVDTLARNHSAALLCFERRPDECHRTVIASTLSERYGFVVRHLGVNNATCRGLGKLPPKRIELSASVAA